MTFDSIKVLQPVGETAGIPGRGVTRLGGHVERHATFFRRSSSGGGTAKASLLVRKGSPFFR